MVTFLTEDTKEVSVPVHLLEHNSASRFQTQTAHQFQTTEASPSSFLQVTDPATNATVVVPANELKFSITAKGMVVNVYVVRMA